MLLAKDTKLRAAGLYLLSKQNFLPRPYLDRGLDRQRLLLKVAYVLGNSARPLVPTFHKLIEDYLHLPCSGRWFRRSSRSRPAECGGGLSSGRCSFIYASGGSVISPVSSGGELDLHAGRIGSGGRANPGSGTLPDQPTEYSPSGRSCHGDGDASLHCL